MKTEIGNLEIFEAPRCGCGMTMLTIQRLLEEVQKHPGGKVYTNFELPKSAKEIIEKYATIERVDAEHQDDWYRSVLVGKE